MNIDKLKALCAGLPSLLLAMVLLAGGSLTLAGCEQQGPAEEAGEKVDDAVEEAADSVDDAADEIEDAADRG